MPSLSPRAVSAAATADVPVPPALLRADLRDLPEYRLADLPCRHKLDQNEMPWGPPPAVRRAVAAALAELAWQRYPDFHADRLRAAIARHHDWSMEGVLAGNGSNELLALALAALAGPGREVLIPTPTFGLYGPMARLAGASPRFLAPRVDLRLPLAELVAEVERDPHRPVVLCSPNNPTGAAATPREVDELLSRLQAPLLLDEAYAELSRHDLRPLLARHPHLVIFRTFSKAWGLAAFRVGYLLAAPDLVAGLRKVKLPYNLNPVSAAAAEAALAAAPAMERRVAVIRRRRDQWAAMLAVHRLEVFSSQANFLLARAGRGEEGQRRQGRLVGGFAARGIRVRDVSAAPGLAGCFRVSVGTGRQLRAVDRALIELAREEAR